MCTFEELEQDEEGKRRLDLNALSKGIAALALTAMEGLRFLTAETTSCNNSAKPIPSVLPLELYSSFPAEFVKISSAHHQRFEHLQWTALRTYTQWMRRAHNVGF